MRNIVAGRFGGLKAEEKLKKLVSAFRSVDGNHVCILRDPNQVTIGMVFQSAAQAEMFRRWPETVVMDWTYSTNNLDYNLGAVEPHRATLSPYSLRLFCCRCSTHYWTDGPRYSGV